MVVLFLFSVIKSDRRVVLMMILSGLFFMIFNSCLINGLNSLVLIIILKYKMVNSSIVVDGVICFNFFSIMFLMFLLKFLIIVKRSGMIIKVMIGDIFFDIMRYVKIIIIVKFSIVSI